MNYLSLTLRIVAILAAIAAGFLYFLSEGTLDEKETELAQIRAELQALLDTNELTNLDVSELQEKLTVETKLVEETKIQLEEAQAELVAEMQESQSVQNKLIETQRKVIQLEETTNRLREELINTENLFAAASKESLIAQLNERIEKLTVTNVQLRGKTQASTSLTDDDAAVYTEPTTGTTGPTQFTAQTLTSDELSAIKEETKIASLSTANGIIVLDAGKKLNLAPGTTINLVKGSETIAQVEIININGSLAIGNIRPGAKLDDLSKGDTVKILR